MPCYFFEREPRLPLMDPDAAGDISMLYSTIYATMSFFFRNMGRQQVPFTQATALVTFEFSSSFRMNIELSTSFGIESCLLQDVHVQEKKNSHDPRTK